MVRPRFGTPLDGDPPGHPVAEPPTHRRREAWIARLATYGLVATLALAAVAQLELWPVSSFRLFSERRTGERVSYVLVAIDDEGVRHPVRLPSDPRVVRSAQRQLPGLASLPVARQRDKVHALLDLAEADDAGPHVGRPPAVVVQRVTRRLDPHGGPAVELRRVDVVRVQLR